MVMVELGFDKLRLYARNLLPRCPRYNLSSRCYRALCRPKQLGPKKIGPKKFRRNFQPNFELIKLFFWAKRKIGGPAKKIGSDFLGAKILFWSGLSVLC